MRVLIVNTSERTGGAAVAANRLMCALNNNGVKAKMLVRDKETDDFSVAITGGGLSGRWHFLWERWCIFCRLGFSKRQLFAVDTGQCGTDITRTREFKEADIIHLHWINQGMLSLNGIRKILNSGKPVVWTMHDIWPATALCHVALDCRKYLSECSRCPLMPSSSLGGDLARKVWRRKKNLLNNRNTINFVTCSRWLASEARRSKLLTGQNITVIPNPIDTRVFCPADRKMARQAAHVPTDKRIIAFVAQRADNANKGIDYLIKACELLAEEHPDMKDNTAIIVLGGNSADYEGRFKFPVYPLGYVTDTKMIVDVYNSADVFVTPSLSDNLPNTIMEAMACGVPCVGFNVGGIPEMIDHQRNGYVAEFKNAADLARGIRFVLFDADRQSLSEAAVKKVTLSYSQQAVAMKYIETYNHAMAFRRYKI